MSCKIFTRSAFALCFISTCVSANPAVNDLLVNEQWGLHNVPRSGVNATALVNAPSYGDIGTCASKPVISGNEYSCNSFTPVGVDDMDINGPEGWLAYTPALTLDQNEVVIALIDTGIDYHHPDLKAKIWLNPGEATGVDANGDGVDDGCSDSIDGDLNGYADDCHGINALVPRVNADGTLNPAAGDPLDSTVGHGTNMAGVMAAVGNNNSGQYHGGVVGVTGIEQRIRIASCNSGKAEADVFPLIPGVAVPVAAETAIRQCLEYFIALKQAGINIAVINASGGMSKHLNLSSIMYPLVRDKYWLNTPAMYALADQLEQNDITVVAAAGNNSWSIDQNIAERAYFPAAFTNDNIIAVGAINNQGQLWSGTSYGRWSVDVLAPGEAILSTSPRYPLVSQDYADLVVSHGSSQATAYVSGVVALLKANAATSMLDAKSIRRLLLSSGKPLADTSSKTVSGSLVRLADNNGRGALTCSNQPFRRRQLPQADSMVALPGEIVVIEVQNFNCAAVGNDPSISVTITPVNQTLMLYDNGQGDDRVAGDGIYSGSWTVPHGHFEYFLASGLDTVTGSTDVLNIKAGIIVDNTGSNTDYVGKWWPSIYRAGFYGTNYRYATEAEPEKIFTWSPLVNAAGYYRVYARWPQGSNFATNTTYRVHHQSPVDGSELVSDVQMNQTTLGNQWNDLGSYWFDAGTRAVDVTNLNANGTVIADAVQLVPEP